MFLFIIILIIFLFIIINYFNKKRNISDNYRNVNFLENNIGFYWQPNVCDPYNQPCYSRYKYINGYFYPLLSNRYKLPMY